MKLITRQSLANKACERWAEQYPIERWPDRQLVLKKLIELGDNCNPDEVDAIIGNGSWTRTKCDECNNDDGVDVIQLGQEPDYESNTANICKDCLDKGLFILAKSE